MAKINSQDQGEIFTLVDEKGNEELYKEALRFQADNSAKWYICLYPLDQEDSEEVDMQAFEIINGDSEESSDAVQLVPIQSDEEWDMVQEVINTFIDDDGNFNI